MPFKRFCHLVGYLAGIATLFHCLATFSFLHYADHASNPTRYDFFLYLMISGMFVTLLASFLAEKVYLSVAVLVFSSINIFLLTVYSQRGELFGFLLLLALMWLFFFLRQRRLGQEVLALSLEIEKAFEVRNKLEASLQHAHNEVEVDFGRYSNYFKLREVAEGFATSLALPQVTRMIVTQSLQVLKKGDASLLFLTDVHEQRVSLVASKSQQEGVSALPKQGTVFDQWILKSQQPLIVADSQRDFRFDAEDPELMKRVRSLIACPLVNEKRVIGTLRINASKPDIFATEDLRILTILAGLASSAIWNALLYQRTEELAIRDSLTHLYVQRHFRRRLKEEHQRSLLNNAPLTLLLCDLDHFKQYNDQFGHAAGDLALQAVSRVFISVLGEDAIAARYGGEEFALVLSNTAAEEGLQIAEQIRQQVAALSLPVRGAETKITLSIGLSAFPVDTLDCEDLISKADRKLYDAKKKGRNRVC